MNHRAPSERELFALRILAPGPLDADSFEIEFFGTVERGSVPSYGSRTKRGRALLGNLRSQGWVEGGPPEPYRLTVLGQQEVAEAQREGGS